MAKLYCLKNFNDIIFYERLDNKVRYEKVFRQKFEFYKLTVI